MTLEKYGSRDYYDGKYILYMLAAITGQDWKSGTIRGIFPGDWQNIIYAADSWSPAALSELESEYINTGTKWIIHDGDNVPDGPEDITGYSVYIHDGCDVRGTLAEITGADKSDIILYAFDGFTRTATYKREEYDNDTL